VRREREEWAGGCLGWALAQEEKEREAGLGPAGRKEKREGRKRIPFFFFQNKFSNSFFK